MDDDLDDIDVDDEALDVAEPEPQSGDTLTRDIEESIAKQRAAKGDPQPYRDIEGRNDTLPGGRYEGMEEFAARARANGTTIQAALKDYDGIEKALRRDVVSGTEYLFQRMGVDPRAVVAQLHQRCFGQGGQQHVANMAYQGQVARHLSEVTAFKSDPRNEHFDALRMDMARLVQAGKATTLKAAYNAALKQHPTLHVNAIISRRNAARDRDMAKGRRR